METDEGIASDSESPTSVQSLIRQMHDKEQRVLNLQAEVVKVTTVNNKLTNYLWPVLNIFHTKQYRSMICMAILPI